MLLFFAIPGVRRTSMMFQVLMEDSGDWMKPDSKSVTVEGGKVGRK
jgi:hypothetical protein